MLTELNEIETRIVGCLVEKQLTTPEYYPLTLNALVAACNQKSNREPVTNYGEQEIERALDILRDKNLVYVFYGSSSRVPKYKHMLPSVFELDERETALASVLMLRGAQTIGELNQRTGRLYEFSGLNEISETLDDLAKREEPIVLKLERQPGQKEGRYAHLLSGAIDIESYARESANAQLPRADRISELERELENIRSEFNLFRESFEEFKKQFD
ncbi:MAG: YceH family protein [Pyrinomonadaceae bacterium]